MGQPLAFISYRRSDSSLASQALHIQLRERFGPSRVFMDVGAIAVGDQWADRLRRAINKATVVLAVVGTGWLKAADAFGRRRLDQPNDWVRLEILTALAARTPILPLLIGGGSEMLPAEGLPPELQPLLNVQMLRLREERWDDDVDLVVAALVKDYGFIASDRRVILPQPEIQIPALAEAQLSDALQTLPGWEPVETLVAGDYPNARQELRRRQRTGARQQHEVGAPQAPRPFAQIPGWQALVVAKRQLGVDADQIEVAMKSPVLETVVEHDHRRPLCRQSRGTRNAVRILLLQQPR